MKIAVFYYTQSGQALTIAKTICKPIEEKSNEGNYCVVYKEIIPEQQYPFPWNKEIFFDTFPETRLGLPPSGIKPIDFSDIEDASLIIVAGQSWFLSPSLPLQSFFLNEEVKNYLNGRKVIFVNSCRNMWLMTIQKIKRYLTEANASLVGHIVLQDKAPNLISVITIIRWLMYGKKEATLFLPSAGISKHVISNSSIFGNIILECLDKGCLDTLQQSLLTAGAIKYKPSIVFMERTGHRMFGLWAKFIRKKGGFRNKGRLFRINCFYYYLLFVLFIISPFGQLLFYLTYPLHQVKRHKQIDCNV